MWLTADTKFRILYQFALMQALKAGKDNKFDFKMNNYILKKSKKNRH